MYLRNEPSCEVDMLLEILETNPAPKLFGLPLPESTICKMRIIESMSDTRFKKYIEHARIGAASKE